MDLTTLKEVKVLLVDDDEDDYVIIKTIFSKIKNSPFKLEWTNSYENAKDIIYSNSHDIYLIDYRLGDHTGLELLKYAQPEQRTQPFILLTGVGNEAVEWQSLELAASDYLVKGAFDANILARTLYYALQRKRVEEQRLQHLVDLNRSKDEFISIASHQLRTPATGVKQYIGMMLEGFAGEMSPTQTQLLEKAYESNERQLKIVTDLLKVAQVDAGRVMLKKTEVDICEFLCDIIYEHREIFSSRDQTIEIIPLGYELKIELDVTSIRMVVENLLDNASKYSEHGSHIEVSVKEKDDSLLIHVKDEGVGIDPQHKARLFAKFSRLDNSLSTKVGGTGLGLYWAQKIVRLHGGKITYVTNKARGTTFTIKLPKDDKV